MTEKVTHKSDEKARVTLFDDFADQMLIVERVSDNELRVVRAIPKRITLAEMLATIPEGCEYHAIIDYGPPKGNEVW